MYHIKPDKRSQTSAKLITEGLYRCLAEKNFSNITISDIQRASTVSRATFYRLFDNLADVLEYECDNAFRQMLAQDKSANTAALQSASPFEALFTSFIDYWVKHTKLLDALMDSQRIDIMNTIFLSHTDEIRAILVPNTDLTKKEVEYFVSVATGAIFGVFFAWTRNGKKETSTELIALLRCSIETVEKSLIGKKVDFFALPKTST